MNGFFSSVEREQQSTAGPEHSFEFQKYLRQFPGCEVDNRVEGGNGPQESSATSSDNMLPSKN